MPDSLRTIGVYAFSQCDGLKHVILNRGLETLGEMVFSESGVEDVQFPPTLRKIGYKTFASCNNFKYVQLPPSLEEIGEDCFVCSGLE